MTEVANQPPCELDVYRRIILRWDVWSKQDTEPNEKGRFGYRAQKRELTGDDVIRSLVSTGHTIGVYTVKPIDNTVVNPTIDIDNHDGKSVVDADVKIIYNALRAGGMFPYIEASAGELKDGAHVGVIGKPTLAATAKKAIQKILDATGLKHELNPKQEAVNKDGFGNLVKLPFQYNNRTKARSQIINPETFEPFTREEAIKFMLALPDTVFESEQSVETPIQAAKETRKATTEAIKSDMGFAEVFALNHIKPCIVKAYNENLILHGKGDDGHNFRLAIAGNLIFNGATEDQVLQYFSIQPDFSRDITIKQLNSIKSYLIGNKKPMGCRKIMEKCRTILNGMCDTCNQKPKERKQKEKTIQNAIKSNGAFDYIDKIAEKTPIYYDEAGQFWLWNKEGFYRQVDNTEILLTLLIDIADPAIIQTKFKGELLEAARLRGRDARVKPVPNNWIHVQNRVYDIKTGELLEATPDYLFTDPIPHKIGDSEETPTIDKLFSEWVTPEKVKLLNEIAAYCIYNGYPIHRMFILFGRGRNGKGQFRDFIVNLVGRQNRTASTLEQLINSRFETARLFNKKICTMGEINYTLLDRTAILKMLSGGDPIPGEKKNKAPFDFVNTAKLLINTNSLPQTSDKTDAFYSRCILVEFGQQFQLGKDVIETIPDYEYDNFLTKSLRVLGELLDRGEFTNEGDIRAKEVEYERLSNPLTQFISTYYEPDPNGTVAAWRIFEKYVTYCIEKGYRKPQNQRDFNNMLKVNYDVEKKNMFDEEVKDWVNWVWVFGIKSKDLPHLPNLPEVPLRSPIEISNEISDKSGKSDKSDIERPCEHLPFDTKIEAPKTGKLPVTELTQLLFEFQAKWGKGQVNSSNETEFSLRFVDTFRPQWQATGETGFYTPSDIKGIIKKLFKITPDVVCGTEVLS